MKKRIVAFLLAGVMSFSAFMTGTSTVVHAAQVENTVNTVQELPMPKESDYVIDESDRNLATKFIKESIEFIIKHGDEAAKVIEKVSGKTVAKNFLKYFDKIAGGLKPLLEWAEIPTNAVYDAVYRALVNAGASNSVVTNIALAIKEGLSWLI